MPSYNHGGGKTEYKGNNAIAPGAFKYKSPCPPGRTHTYEWKVIAYDDNKKLGSAVAQRKYLVIFTVIYQSNSLNYSRVKWGEEKMKL